MQFKDYFSAQSDEYARRRPHYPPELFEYLSLVVEAHDQAWDCGTGNGQAALGLAPYFERVIATDPSADQLRNAAPHPKVTYKQVPAEDSGLPSSSVDLVTVAQALHWFDLPRFFEEAGRVLKPGGVIAVWAYTLCRIEPEIDRIVDDFYYNVVGSYWPPERRLVDSQYKTIAFPFEEFEAPPFSIELDWNLNDMLGYIRTWSPLRRYMEANGSDPTELILEPLAVAWGDPQQQRRVTFPIHMRAGRRDGGESRSNKS
jgi:SAM-dependent methyltransferase